MKRACMIVLFVCSFCAVNVHAAATKALTLADNMKVWFTATGKDFKQIKTKTTLTTVSPFARRMLESLGVTGLEAGGTIYATLAADMQTALTRLNGDLQTTRTKNNEFQRLINSVMYQLGNIANSTTPASIASAQNLYAVMYAAAGDGEFSDKDKDQVNDALADVLASTPSLPAADVTSLQSDVAAMLAGQGVTKADLGIITADLKSIGDLIKALK